MSSSAAPYLDCEPDLDSQRSNRSDASATQTQSRALSNQDLNPDETLDATLPAHYSHSQPNSARSATQTHSAYTPGYPAPLDQVRQFSALVSSYSHSARSIAVNASRLSKFLDPHPLPPHLSRQFTNSHGVPTLVHSPSPPSSAEPMRPAWNSSPDLNWDMVVAGSRSIKLDQTNSQTRKKHNQLKISQRSGRVENPPLVSYHEQNRFAPPPASGITASSAFGSSQRSIDQLRMKETQITELESFYHGKVYSGDVQCGNDNPNELEKRKLYWRIQGEKRAELLGKGYGVGLSMLKREEESKSTTNHGNGNGNGAADDYLSRSQRRAEYYSRGCPAAFQSSKDRVFSDTLIQPIGNPRDFRTVYNRDRARRLIEQELRGRDYNPLTGVKIKPME